MAGSVKGITVEIGGDTTKLGKALESSEKQSRNLQKELKQVNTALKFNPNNVELVTQKQKLLTDQIKATEDKLKTLRAAEAQVAAQFKAGEIGEEQFREFQREIVETESKLKTYKNQLEETGKKASALDELTETIREQESEVSRLKDEYKNAVLQFGKNSDEAKDLANQIDDLSGELVENKNKMTDLDRAADELDNSLDQVDDGARKAGDGFTVMKGVLANLATDVIRRVADGLKDLAKKTLDVGMSFESSMSNNAALFGATGEELDKLSATAQHYGETTVFSASEAADALGYMALAGWDAEKASNELGGVLDLAAASGMGLAEASDMVTDYLSAFSNTTMTAAEFADKLAYAQANSNTTAKQLGEAYKNAAANLNAAGQDVETVTSLLAAMANQGLKGSEAGTALTAMMRDLTAKMKDGKVQIGDTAVAVMDANGNYRDLTDILRDVEKATNGMGDAEKAAALSATFTADSIKGVNLIMNDGVDKAAEFEKSLRNCDGAAGTMADTMNDNVAGSLKLLRSNIESKMIKVFEKAKDAIKKAIETISKALDSLDWDAIADAVGRFAQKIADFLAWCLQNSDTVIGILKAIGTAIATIFAVKVISNFVTGLMTIKDALSGIFTMISAHPIVGIIAGAAAGIAAIVTALQAVEKERQEQIEQMYGLNEEEQALVDKITEEKEAIDQARDARLENNRAIEAEFAQTSNLWSELQNITDENGKIKAGYEDRAAVVTGLLADALGIEISIVDGQIQKYDELKGSIEKVISTKRAEALLDANKEAYSDAISKQAGAYNDYVKAVEDANKRRDALNQAEEKANRLYDEMSKTTYYSTESMNHLREEYRQQLMVVDTLRNSYNTQAQAVSDAESNYYSYASMIENYEGAMAAMASGDVDVLSEALDRLSVNFMTSETASREMLEKQLTNFKEQYVAMKTAVDAGMPGVTQAQVDAMGELVNAAEAELNKLGPKAEESGKASGADHAAGVASTAEDNADAGETVSDAANAGMGSADTNATGKTKGDEFVAGVASTSGSANTAGKNVSDGTNAGMGTANTNATGQKKGNEFTLGVNLIAGAANTAGQNLVNNANSGAGSISLSPTGQKEGQTFVSGVNSQGGSANTAGRNLASNANTGAGSVSSYGSGQNFSQGFINGIGSLVNSAWSAAKNLASQAWAGLKRGQAEGSPSKLTYQSGIFFDEGYINAIKDKTKEAVKAAQSMAQQTAAALNGYAYSGDFLNDLPVNGLTFDRQLNTTFTGPGLKVDNSSLLQKLDAVMDAIAQHSGNAIVLDTGVLVGQTVKQYDSALADVYGLKARGI